MFSALTGMMALPATRVLPMAKLPSSFSGQTLHTTVSDAGQAGHACEAKQAGGEKRSATSNI